MNQVVTKLSKKMHHQHQSLFVKEPYLPGYRTHGDFDGRNLPCSSAVTAHGWEANWIPVRGLYKEKKSKYQRNVLEYGIWKMEEN